MVYTTLINIVSHYNFPYLSAFPSNRFHIHPSELLSFAKLGNEATA